MLLTWQRAEGIPYFSIVSGDTYQRSGRRGTEQKRWNVNKVYSLSDEGSGRKKHNENPFFMSLSCLIDLSSIK